MSPVALLPAVHRSARSLRLAWRSMGANRLPAFPAPSFSGGETSKQSSGEMSRENVKACLRVRYESKERCPPTHTPSLRAQRSNPESFRGGILDCFAALAMTPLMPLRANTQLSCPGRSAASLRRKVLQSRGPCNSALCGFLGPGSAQQRKNAAARPGLGISIKPACPYTASTPSSRRPPGTPGR